MLFPIFFIVMQITSTVLENFHIYYFCSFILWMYSLQVSRWRWLKLLLQAMQESLLLVLISAHARMVHSSSRNTFTGFFSVFKCNYHLFKIIFAGLICVGGDGIVNEVSYFLHSASDILLNSTGNSYKIPYGCIRWHKGSWNFLLLGWLFRCYSNSRLPFSRVYDGC